MRQAIQTRRTFSEEGLFKGWYKNGASQYIIGIPPYFALLKSVKYSFISPYYIGPAYLFGYYYQYIMRKKRIDDKQVIYYNSIIRVQEVRNRIIKKISNFILF